MSELTLFVLQLGFLGLLWAFVFSIVMPCEPTFSVPRGCARRK